MYGARAGRVSQRYSPGRLPWRLSEGMLAKARGRGLYDELHQAELTAYMPRHGAHYDVVVSGDTLV